MGILPFYRARKLIFMFGPMFSQWPKYPRLTVPNFWMTPKNVRWEWGELQRNTFYLNEAILLLKSELGVRGVTRQKWNFWANLPYAWPFKGLLHDPVCGIRFRILIDQRENARGVNIGGNLWVQRFLVNFRMLITYMLGGRVEAGAFSSYKVLQDIRKGLWPWLQKTSFSKSSI